MRTRQQDDAAYRLQKEREADAWMQTQRINRYRPYQPYADD